MPGSLGTKPGDLDEGLEITYALLNFSGLNNPWHSWEAKMKELDDYSGQFVPNIQFEDFSKEALIKLLKTYSLCTLILPWGWLDIVKQRHGEDEGNQCWLQVWVKVGAPMSERLARGLNIQDKDVVGLLKSIQLNPTVLLDRFRYTVEVKNSNLGILAITRCPALDIWEKEGNTELIQFCCHELEVPLFEALAKPFHPNMKAIPLKLPPRQSPDEIACQWEIRI